jgi:hypothetical protein
MSNKVWLLSSSKRRQLYNIHSSLGPQLSPHIALKDETMLAATRCRCALGTFSRTLKPKEMSGGLK